MSHHVIYQIQLFIFCLLVQITTVEQASSNTSPAPVQRSSPNQICQCFSHIDDKYEEPVVMNFGPFAGQCVDTCRFRRVITLGKSEAAPYRRNQDEIVIANILHEGRFWIAAIPVNQTKESRIIFEDFLKGISHVAIRFIFDDHHPVRLYPQALNSKEIRTAKVQPHYLTDLLFSAEGTPPIRKDFELVDSALGRYWLSYRFLSTLDFYIHAHAKKGHPIRQFRLSLNSEQRRQALIAGINKSENGSFQTRYDLLQNNCATSAVDLLEPFGFSDTIGKNSKELSQSLQLANQKRPTRSLPEVIPSALAQKILHVERGIPYRTDFGTAVSLMRRGLISSMDDQLENLENEYRVSPPKIRSQTDRD
jgi:hypothetical protein